MFYFKFHGGHGVAALIWNANKSGVSQICANLGYTVKPFLKKEG